MKNIIYFIQNIKWRIKYFLINIFRTSPEKAERNIINYMLKPYKVDIQYVIDNPKIEGKDWFFYYTFNSVKEYDKWKKYALKQFKKAYPYSTDEFNLRRFSWIDLCYGLRQDYIKSNKELIDIAIDNFDLIKSGLCDLSYKLRLNDTYTINDSCRFDKLIKKYSHEPTFWNKLIYPKDSLREEGRMNTAYYWKVDSIEPRLKFLKYLQEKFK